MQRLLVSLVLLFAMVLSFSAAGAEPPREDQSAKTFLSFGPGFTLLTRDGSAGGISMDLQGGHYFQPGVAVGIHGAYTYSAGINTRLFDFGLFGQFSHEDTGIFGRVYVDYAIMQVGADAGRLGIRGNQDGFMPGFGAGVRLPAKGQFHMAPEFSYKSAIVQSNVTVLSFTVHFIGEF